MRRFPSFGAASILASGPVGSHVSIETAEAHANGVERAIIRRFVMAMKS
jgi:hypothetical protein